METITPSLIVTIRQLEVGVRAPGRSTLDVVRRALEAAGVEFIEKTWRGASVRLRSGRAGLDQCELPPLPLPLYCLRGGDLSLEEVDTELAPLPRLIGPYQFRLRSPAHQTGY